MKLNWFTQTLAVVGMLLTSSTLSAATITAGSATDNLGPNFFLDAAAVGGGDFQVDQPGVASFVRDFGLLNVGSLGTDISISGIGWASPNAPAQIDLTSAMVSFTYLGADGAIGGDDDVLLGSVTDAFGTFAGAGEYYWLFDAPVTGSIDGLNSFFQISFAPMNESGTGSIRMKTTTGSGAGAVKLTVAGTSTPLGDAPILWNIDGSGLWSEASNWNTNEVPGVGPNIGSQVTFGAVITAPATVTLDVDANLSGITFGNATAYAIDGGNTITLSGDASINTTAGTHRIDAAIAGSSGLNKLGAGSLVLAGTNTYSGTTNIADGDLRVFSTTAIPVGSTVQIETPGDLIFEGDAAGGGYNGTFANTVAGSGRVVTAANLTTEVVSLGSSLAGHTGQLVVNGGTMRITNASAFGASTGTVDQTIVGGGTTNSGTLLLDGGISVAGETLFIGGRAAELAPSVSSIGNNTWSGPITTGTGGDNFEFESQSGTLTLAGTITMADAGLRNLVLSGAGNGRITANFANNGADNMLNDNLNVVKQGSGTWTIRPSSDPLFTTATQYTGLTTVAQGTLTLENDGTGANTLAGSIHVAQGAQLNLTSYSNYEVAPGTTLSGGGQVQTGGALSVYGDNSLTPGDGVGTLAITGGLNLLSLATGGALNFELGATTTVGGGVNDLIAVSGALTTTAGSHIVNITPVAGGLAAGNYTLIDAASGSGASPALEVNLVAIDGSALNTRLTANVTRPAADVLVSFSGSTQNATWTGAASANWDVATSNNWNTSDSQFRDLDNVTFADGPSNTFVNVATTVSPGSVTFANSGSDYTLAGSGAVLTGAALNVTGGGNVRLANTGGNQFGNINLASGKLTVSSAATASGTLSGTGQLVVDGTLTAASGVLGVGSQIVGGGGQITGSVTTTAASTIRVGGIGAGTPFRTANLQLDFDAARDLPGDTFWNDQAALAGFVNLQFTMPPATTPVAATPVAVSDATFQQLSLAYDTSVIAATSPGAQNAYFDGRALDSGSFDIVFNVTDLNAGAGQVLIDVGGGRGMSLTLNDDQLFAAVNGDGPTAAIQTTITEGWHHAVIVVNENNPDNAMNDGLSLYLNGSLVQTLTDLDLDDWAGGNAWGIGGPGTVVLDPLGSADETLATPQNFHGQVASARYYFAALGQDSVDQNYAALLDPTPLVGADTLTIDGDFNLAAGATLEMDVFGVGNHDLLSVTGEATLAGLIDISLVNGFAPAVGDTFTILSAAGGLVDAGLSLVGDGMFDFAIVNGTDLVLSIAGGNLGDYNGDGIVDAADYTVWRDSLGSTGPGLVADGNNDGTVDAADYAVWRSNFGNNYISGSVAGNAAVPEPTTIVLMLLGSAALGTCRRRR